MSTTDLDFSLSAKTACFTIFVFEKFQYSTLFGSMSNGAKRTYLAFMLKNGKLKIESKGYSGGPFDLPDTETASSSMYDVGWNFI